MEAWSSRYWYGRQAARVTSSVDAGSALYTLPGPAGRHVTRNDGPARPFSNAPPTIRTAIACGCGCGRIRLSYAPPPRR
jgi:hypothetical protein